jgi:hypothetical protein
MDDWEAIPLSRLAHAGYCLRRAALLTNEQLWKENSDTAKRAAKPIKGSIPAELNAVEIICSFLNTLFFPKS